MWDTTFVHLWRKLTSAARTDTWHHFPPAAWEMFRHACSLDKVVYGDQWQWPGIKKPPSPPGVVWNSFPGSGESLNSPWSRSDDGSKWRLGCWWARLRTVTTLIRDNDRFRHSKNVSKKGRRKKIWPWRMTMSSIGKGIDYDLLTFSLTPQEKKMCEWSQGANCHHCQRAEWGIKQEDEVQNRTLWVRYK